MTMRNAWRVAGFLVVLCATGCGQDKMRVWGEVTFEDKPIETGTIEFLPRDGTPGPSTGGVIKEGKYDVPAKVGPLTGKSYLVSITAMAKTGKTASNPLDPKAPPTP